MNFLGNIGDSRNISAKNKLIFFNVSQYEILSLARKFCNYFYGNKVLLSEKYSL